MSPSHSRTPIIAVPSARKRGAVHLPAKDRERRQTERAETRMIVAEMKCAPRAGEDQPKSLRFENTDPTTHHLVQGHDGLPTLIPRFLEHATINQPCKITCDRRPSSELLLSSYLNESHAHFGSLLSDAVNAIGPLPKRCKESICSPAAARDEARYIGRTVRALANQTVDPETFEVLVFLNCLSGNGRVDSAARGTIAALEEAMRENPQLTVRPFFAALPKDEIWTIGRIRKLLFDSVVQRVFDRNRRRTSHVMITLDADAAAMHPEFVAHERHVFQSRPDVDAIRARVDWDWKEMQANPLLLLGIKLTSVFDAHRRLSDRTYGVGTPGFAIRVDRYVDAGGYHYLDATGEDMDLISRAKNIRVGSKKFTAIIDGGPRSRSWYSCRRAERALEIDLTPPCNQWFVDGARFKTEDPKVRRGSLEPKPPFDTQLADPDFERKAATLIRKTLEAYALSYESCPYTVDELRQLLNRISGLELELTEEPPGLRI